MIARTSHKGEPAVVGVLVVADVRLYREGLSLVLSCASDITVVGVAADEQDARELLRETPPAVVLVDIGTRRGLQSLGSIVVSAAETPVVAIGIDGAEADIIACAEAGVAGYVTREGSGDDLIAAVVAASRGELECSARVAALLFKRVASLAAEQRSASQQPEPPLTRREQEIVELLGHGLSNKEIAARLHIEVATVKNHVHRIIEKLKIRRRGEVPAAMRRRAGPAVPAQHRGI
jgi:DNA-binding NarL/FixJ family response regulator